MEVETEKDCSALGGLFQFIVSDLKGGTPVWEDFLAKATKLHSQLKITASVSAAFLDSFQKVADMATNTKGATKEVGKALTRLCLRHRSVEAKLKSFTSSIMDHLVVPLQDKMEDWKKITLQLDKDHSKEFKRARQEIKKMSTDTLRLQKKVKKGAKWEMQRSLDCALQEVSDKYLLLEETEKQAVRRALIEERGRYCLLVACLRPVVEEELLMLHEIAHLQEIVESLGKLTSHPDQLPSASEQVIADLKGLEGSWAFQTPPSSPSSLGSRKSSMCSISSFNSSSSGSTKSHSPSHQFRSRSLSQQPAAGPPLRLSSVSSQDSGFTSQDTLFLRPPSPRATNGPAPVSGLLCDPGGIPGGGGVGCLSACTSSTPSSPFPTTPSVTSTWPNLQDTLQFERAMSSVLRCQRPHTISSAYERSGHQLRPLLTAETFQPLEGEPLCGGSNHSGSADTLTSASGDSTEGIDGGKRTTVCAVAGNGAAAPHPKSPQTPTRGPRPPVPVRTTSGSSTPGPCVPEKPSALKAVPTPTVPVVTLPDFHKPLPCQVLPQPIYANAADLMGSPRRTESPPLPPPPPVEDSVVAEEPMWHGMAGADHVYNSSPQATREGQMFRMYETYKTYSPSSAVTRYEGMSGSSTLPAKSSFRRGSQQPPPPPIRRTPSITGSQGSSSAVSPLQPPDRVTEYNGTARGVEESEDSSASRVKLIQALNARFSNPSPLEQAGLRFSLPSNNRDLPPPLVEPDPGGDSNRFPSLLSDRDPALLCAVAEQQTRRHPEKKLIRAHTIGYSERDALIQSLNAKFSATEEAPLPHPEPKQAVIRKTSLREETTPVNRSPRSAAKSTTKPETELFRTNLEHALLKREPKKERGNNGQECTPEGGRRSRSVGPAVTAPPPSSDRRQFLDALNARLAEQRSAAAAAALQQRASSPRRGSLQPEAEFGNRRKSEHRADQRADRAARVHSWLAGRGSVDLGACRESLMDQIRRGTSLKRVAAQSGSDPTTPHLL